MTNIQVSDMTSQLYHHIHCWSTSQWQFDNDTFLTFSFDFLRKNMWWDEKHVFIKYAFFDWLSYLDWTKVHPTWTKIGTSHEQKFGMSRKITQSKNIKFFWEIRIIENSSCLLFCFFKWWRVYWSHGAAQSVSQTLRQTAIEKFKATLRYAWPFFFGASRQEEYNKRYDTHIHPSHYCRVVSEILNTACSLFLF